MGAAAGKEGLDQPFMGQEGVDQLLVKFLRLGEQRLGMFDLLQDLVGKLDLQIFRKGVVSSDL